MKRRLLTNVLNGIFAVGMSTVDSISRYDAYEPEEDVQLAKWAEKHQEEN